MNLRYSNVAYSRTTVFMLNQDLQNFTDYYLKKKSI